MRWLVDGYNVIRRAPELKSREQESLEGGRQALCALLVEVARRSEDTFTVVFDGAQTGGRAWRAREAPSCPMTGRCAGRPSGPAPSSSPPTSSSRDSTRPARLRQRPRRTRRTVRRTVKRTRRRAGLARAIRGVSARRTGPPVEPSAGSAQAADRVLENR